MAKKQAPFYVKIHADSDFNGKGMYLVVSHTLYEYRVTHPDLESSFKIYKAKCFTDLECRKKTRDAREAVGICTKKEFIL